MSETPSPFWPDGRQWAWNTSALELAKICPRKYLLAYREGWRRKGGSHHLVFGSHYAKALEYYHMIRAKGWEHNDAVVSVVEYTMLKTWDFEKGHPWHSADPKKNRETLIRSIIWYLDEFEHDPCKTVILPDGQPAVELSSRFEIGDGIVLCQHNDRLVQYGDDFYVQDQKTTGHTISSYYFSRYDMSSQMSQYSLAAEIVWKFPVRGVMIDAAQIAVGFTKFERGFTFRTPDQNIEWLAETHYHVRRTWEAAKAGYPRNDAACGLYGGCQLIGICSKSNHVRAEFLRTDFVQEPLRNPLEE